MLVIEDYYPCKNSPFTGNPLITYAPLMDPEALAIALSSSVQFPEGYRTHPSHLRIAYLPWISGYFIPLDHMVDFIYSVYTLIIHSYVNRNPLSTNKSQRFREKLKSIADGTQQPDGNAQHTDAPWGVTLIGTPGSGKSSIVNALLKLLGPELLHHRQHGQLYQLLSVTVELTTGSRNKGVAKQIFEALRDAAVETPHFVPDLPLSATEGDYKRAIKKLANSLNLGVLVLDEIQHLYNGTSGLDKGAMTFLTGLSNDLKAPILIVGTWQALPLLAQEARLARRAFSPISSIFRRMPRDETWDGFLLGLFRLQVLQHTVPSEELSECMYYHCQGIADVTVKFFVLCQLEAIRDGTEILTHELLNRAAQEHMRVLAPWVDLMRNGRSEADVKIYDAEPVDFSSYLQTQMERYNIRSAGKQKSGSGGAQVDSGMVSKVAEAFVAAGLLSQQAAVDAAEAQVKHTPHASTSEHIQRVLNSIRPRSPKRTRSVKPAAKKKEIDGFSKLENSDIRKIVYFALREERQVEASLRDAGHLCSVTEDLEF